MTFRPKLAGNKEKMLSVVLAVIAVILFAVSAFVAKFELVYQITAIVSAVVALQIYLKYVMNDYVYEAAADSLKIYKVTGNKSVCVLSLDYEMSLSKAVSKQEYLSDKSRFPKTNFNVNLAKNLAPENYYVYFFEFNEKKSMLKFEPDKVFADYLNEKIENALNNRNNEDE